MSYIGQKLITAFDITGNQTEQVFATIHGSIYLVLNNNSLRYLINLQGFNLYPVPPEVFPILDTIVIQIRANNNVWKSETSISAANVEQPIKIEIPIFDNILTNSSTPINFDVDITITQLNNERKFSHQKSLNCWCLYPAFNTARLDDNSSISITENGTSLRSISTYIKRSDIFCFREDLDSAVKSTTSDTEINVFIEGKSDCINSYKISSDTQKLEILTPGASGDLYIFPIKGTNIAPPPEDEDEPEPEPTPTTGWLTLKKDELISSVSPCDQSFNLMYVISKNILVKNLPEQNRIFIGNRTNDNTFLFNTDTPIIFTIYTNNYNEATLKVNYKRDDAYSQVRGVLEIQKSEPIVPTTGLTTPTPYSVPSSFCDSNVRYSWSSVGDGIKYYINVLDSATGETWSYNTLNRYYDDTFNKSRIGHTCKYKVQATLGSETSDWSDWISFVIYGKVTLYNGQTAYSGWNGRAATSWAANQFTPTRTNYQFDGWYTSASGGTKVTAYTTDEFRQNSHLKLYAHWSQNVYNITLNAGDGKIKDGNNKVSTKTYSVPIGSSFTFDKTIEAPTNKSLLGWAKTDSGNVEHTQGQSYTPTKSITWYASYGSSATISYDVNLPTKIGGGSWENVPTNPADQTKQYGATITLPSTLTLTGFKHEGWYDESIPEDVYKPGVKYSGNNSVTLKAKWDPNTYKITEIKPSLGPSLRSEKYTGNWEFNTTITLPPAWNNNTEYDADTWRPKTSFWKIIGNEHSEEGEAEGNFNFSNQNLLSNKKLQIQSQWSKLTSWRAGTLWIYVPKEE